MDGSEAALALSPASPPRTLSFLTLFFLPIRTLPHFLPPSEAAGVVVQDPRGCAPGGGSAAAHPPLPPRRPIPRRHPKGSPPAQNTPLYLHRLFISTFLLVTMQAMIINNHIHNGNNTRYSVIYHLEVGCLRAGYCISPRTRWVRCRHQSAQDSLKTRQKLFHPDENTILT